jgi:hypothetical protein
MSEYELEIRRYMSGVEIRLFGRLRSEPLHGASVWGKTTSDALATLSRMVAADERAGELRKGLS